MWCVAHVSSMGAVRYGKVSFMLLSEEGSKLARAFASASMSRVTCDTLGVCEGAVRGSMRGAGAR